MGEAELRRTDAYDYHLPPDRIARYPAERREGSRLLVIPRGGAGGGGVRDLGFTAFPELLRSGDLLVLNESRVLPVRLLGRKPTGAPCEVLLIRPVGEDLDPSTAVRWEALVRPGSKLKPGREVIVAPGFHVRIEAGAPGGGRIVSLQTSLSSSEALGRFGRLPLPPYLDREEEPLDRERYQTVYARDPGSVAAPTAGLHFTPEVLRQVEARGVEVARVSLHVGPGTFRPVESEELGAHEMHSEAWRVPPEAAAAVEGARARGGRIWAVGTTVVRTLESAAGEDGTLRAGSGETRLFIAPGFRFRVVDGLLTNFHLPRSTLLMLVSAFAGHEATMEAYAHAVASGYRFYSYGDAMAVLPSDPGGSP